MSRVVLGEASESDEETIVNRGVSKSNLNTNQQPIVYAKEVAGEANESDDDIPENCINQSVPDTSRAVSNNECLYRTLIESNITLWKNLTSFIRHIVLSASKQLLNADQLLIKSQVSIQSALASLKQVQSNVEQLKEKTEDVFTANFIPPINI